MDEVAIVNGVLQTAERSVSEAMIPMDKVLQQTPMFTMRSKILGLAVRCHPTKLGEDICFSLSVAHDAILTVHH